MSIFEKKTPEQKAEARWKRSLKPSNVKEKAVEAVKLGYTDFALQLLKSHKFERYTHNAMLSAAVERGNVVMVRKVLEASDFDLSSSHEGDASLTKGYYFEALERGNLDVCMAIVDVLFRQRSNIVSVNELMRETGRVGTKDQCMTMLELLNDQHFWSYAGSLLLGTMQVARSTFDKVLEKCEVDRISEDTFVALLKETIDVNNPSLTMTLADKYGKPVPSRMDLLEWVIEKDADAIMDVLLKNGFELQDFADALRMKHEDKKISLAMQALLQPIVDLDIPSLRQEEGNKEKMKLTTLWSETTEIDGVTIKSIFNFASGQQIVVTEMGDKMNTVVRDFADISQDVVDEAYRKLRASNPYAIASGPFVSSEPKARVFGGKFPAHS